MLWIILAIVVVLVLFAIYAFNRLRRVDIGAQEALGGIDVQLTRRADLIPNLVNTVKGYAQHEKGVFEAVTEARAGAAAAAKGGSVQDKAEAQAKLDKAIIDVLAVAEAYPDLKASANFQSLQAELADTENNLVRAAVLQRRRRQAQQPRSYDPVAAVHRHRRSARPRVLRRPRGPADPAHRHLLTLTSRSPPDQRQLFRTGQHLCGQHDPLSRSDPCASSYSSSRRSPSRSSPPPSCPRRRQRAAMRSRSTRRRPRSPRVIRSSSSARCRRPPRARPSGSSTSTSTRAGTGGATSAAPR